MTDAVENGLAGPNSFIEDGGYYRFTVADPVQLHPKSRRRAIPTLIGPLFSQAAIQRLKDDLRTIHDSRKDCNMQYEDEVRLECLKLAHDVHMTPDLIVRAAGVYLSFVAPHLVAPDALPDSQFSPETQAPDKLAEDIKCRAEEIRRSGGVPRCD